MLESWLPGPLRRRCILPSLATAGAVLVALVLVNVQIHGGYLVGGVPHDLRKAAALMVIVPAVLLFAAAAIVFCVGLACLPFVICGVAVHGLVMALRRRSA